MSQQIIKACLAQKLHAENLCRLLHLIGNPGILLTNVIAAAGVSSSASFEMLVCTIINHFFNEGAMSCADYAKIGKYSENVYWNKGCL